MGKDSGLTRKFLTLLKKFRRGKHSSLFVRFVMIQLLLPPCLTPFKFWSTRDEGKNEEERNSNINYSKDIILDSCLISAIRISATHISFFCSYKTKLFVMKIFAACHIPEKHISARNKLPRSILNKSF